MVSFKTIGAGGGYVDYPKEVDSGWKHSDGQCCRG